MNRDNHKFESNKKYFSISIYAFCVIAFSLIFYKFIGNWDETTNFLKSMVSILSPFLIAFLIAYLLHPIIHWVELHIMSSNKFKHLKIRHKKLKRILSILLVYIVVFSLLALTLMYVIPQMATSLLEIFEELSNYFKSSPNWLESFIDELFKDYPHINLTVVNETLNQYLPDVYEETRKILMNMIPFLYGLSVNVISSAMNIFLAFIIAFYLITEKEVFLRKSKLIMYAFLPEDRASKLLDIFRDSHRIFANFVIGKALDSLIIGILCFIILLLAKIPFPLFISVIVGITNMIPYFGPFIGAIPGIIIIFIVSPMKAFWFSIIILALQQFDGLFLGPKILGDSTGLSPFWVIFSIIVGGGFFGVIGMFLGVPVFAVLNYLFNRAINKRLTGKKCDL